jgi:hypothetical protein
MPGLLGRVPATEVAAAVASAANPVSSASSAVPNAPEVRA